MHASMYVLYIYVQIHVDASKSIREIEIPKYLIMISILYCVYIYIHTHVGLHD